MNICKVNKIDRDIDSDISDYREAGKKLNYFRLFWIPVLETATVVKIALEK